jgi:SAM-dependent methyltransferase
VTGARQARQSGGVTTSTVVCQSLSSPIRNGWKALVFSAIGSSIMNVVPQVFDRALYLARQARASGEALSLLDARVAEELGDRLSVVNRSFDKALLIAPRPGLARHVLKCGTVDVRLPVASDDLVLPVATYQLVVSLLDLHAVNDVPGYMAQIASALVPDGLAMFAFFAGDTLRQLREAWLIAEQEITGGASPRVAPMIDLRETGGLLQRAGLALPVSDIDRLPLRYADAFALMREIKSLGLSNCLLGRSQRITSRRMLLRAAEIYARDFAEPDGRIPATVDIAWAMAWKPHPSQQKPLKPGSAKARLADALKVSEEKL